jgi:hypothetical protein
LIVKRIWDSLDKIESKTTQTDKEQTIRPFFLEEKDNEVFLLRRE